MSANRKTKIRLGSYAAALTAVFSLALVMGCSDSGETNPAGAGNGGGEGLKAKWNGADGIGALFVQRCAPCHTSQSQNGYNVSTYANAADRRVKPGDPDNSLLVKKLEGDPTKPERMPLGGPYLTAAEIDTIRAWIAAEALDN